MPDMTPNPHGFVWFPKVCKATRDGSLWEPSHPGHPACFGFFFRRIRQIWGPLWRRTGETWEFPGNLEGSRKFDIVGWRNA